LNAENAKEATFLIDTVMNKWKDLVIEEVKKIHAEKKIDVIVTDFWSRAGAAAADELGVPNVLNIPGLMNAYMGLGMAGIIPM